MNISIVNKILTVEARLTVQDLAGRIRGSQEARIILWIKPMMFGCSISFIFPNSNYSCLCIGEGTM